MAIKKMMMAAAIVCAAACAQAAVSWGSGNFYMPSSTAGGWTGVDNADLVKNKSQAVGMSLWLVTANQYDTIKGYTQAQLLDFSKTLGDATGTASTYNGTAYGNAASISTTAEASTAYYALLVADMTVASGTTAGSYYMAAVATAATATTGAGAANGIFGGKSTATTGVKNWQGSSTPTPEPTSGLLIALGMAGLALRRRRA